ncbi:MAG: bifunctional 5,10-methylenetetrahydrofolate dehydrogenase/5,10-methenyltetrahydrofolate cyclohydrolase [Candidatus Sungiibacteriota bacterium]|uniref:Bifunctional protein FolD n=1 Tax=Candidatus Sungiibacteriota bacterium TaxID=2750080 RepID=A0A7T5RIX5_9BACT|nr:MAG: bifunctional 5,10-methylenetetrahydrofolate dehydrogenase/5,10-methenyltetrahydrofolate cyclohydrolase [Candidatus Sungbacteria bacterium]
MILLDGKKLSQKILDEVKQETTATKKKLRLAIVVVGENPVVKKFIEQKKKAADQIGAGVRIYPFDEKITTNELRKRLFEIVHEKKNTGVIIQLPLPTHINTPYILNSVTPEKDIDMLSARAIGNFAVGQSPIIPPVVGALKFLLEEYQIDYQQKSVVIVGAGNLVGKPTALWLLGKKATFTVVEERTPHPEELISKAGILITGVGKPGFIRGDMVKNGVIVIDAGTSESAGRLVGDVDFKSVSKKASYITPVPGGIGPLTVAMLFKNLVTLAKIQKS